MLFNYLRLLTNWTKKHKFYVDFLVHWTQIYKTEGAQWENLINNTYTVHLVCTLKTILVH